MNKALVITKDWDIAGNKRREGYQHSYPISWVNGNNFFLKHIKIERIVLVGVSETSIHKRELSWKIGDITHMEIVNEKEIQ